MTSDESLMLQFQGGSRDSFEELFARYREPLYGFFRRRISNRERAEDLVQEAFLAVIRCSVDCRQSRPSFHLYCKMTVHLVIKMNSKEVRP